MKANLLAFKDNAAQMAHNRRVSRQSPALMIGSASGKLLNAGDVVLT